MECPNCHQHVIDTAERCGYCGWQLKAGKPSGVPYQQPASPQASMQQRVPAAPVNYPPPPDGERKKKKKAGWIWFVIIPAILAVIILVIFILSRSRSPSYAYSPSYPQSNGSDYAAPAVQSAPPEAPAESNPVAVVTDAPADVPAASQENPAVPAEVASVNVPDHISDLLDQWYVQDHYAFDTLSDQVWHYSNNNVYVDDSSTPPALTLDAEPGTMAVLSSNFQLYPGSAIVVEFYLWDNPDFEAYLYSGDWQQSNYRRFGIGFTNYSVVMNNWRGTNTLDSGTDFTGDLNASESYAYTLLIAVDQDGVAKAQIWNSYDPTQSSRITSFSGDIADLMWTFQVQVGQGALFMTYADVLYFSSFK